MGRRRTPEQQEMLEALRHYQEIHELRMSADADNSIGWKFMKIGIALVAVGTAVSIPLWWIGVFIVAAGLALLSAGWEALGSAKSKRDECDLESREQ